MNTTQVKQLLNVLEIREINGWENVQRHVRQLLLRFHPDVHAENKIYYEEKTKKILYAYGLLKKYVSEGNPLPCMPEPDPAPVPFPSSFLLFSLGNMSFAFPVENVKEIRKAEGVENHGIYLGKLCVRSEEIPVFSLSALLSLADSQPALFDSMPARPGRIVILAEKQKKAGFLVSHVEDMMQFHEEDFVTGMLRQTSHDKYFFRIALKDKILIPILSPEKIFSALNENAAAKMT